MDFIENTNSGPAPTPSAAPGRTASEALAALEEALDTTSNLSDRARRNARRAIEGNVREQVRNHEKAIVQQAEQFAAKVGGVADDMSSIHDEIDRVLRDLHNDPTATAADAYRIFQQLQAEAGKRFDFAGTFVEAYAGQMEGLTDPVAHLSAVQQKFPMLRRHYGI
ncbi:hypothetical protein ACFUIZ_14870 [Streptomyces cinereoruber]|uniref:hypothetical protein n=1 Tax=Streptomyces cinereoruber TaxID=67260 RepID=UPI003626C806